MLGRILKPPKSALGSALLVAALAGCWFSSVESLRVASPDGRTEAVVLQEQLRAFGKASSLRLRVFVVARGESARSGELVATVLFSSSVDRVPFRAVWRDAGVLEVQQVHAIETRLDRESVAVAGRAIEVRLVGCSPDWRGCASAPRPADQNAVFSSEGSRRDTR